VDGVELVAALILERVRPGDEGPASAMKRLARFEAQPGEQKARVS